jgi:hypothetical protein
LFIFLFLNFGSTANWPTWLKWVWLKVAEFISVTFEELEVG